MIRRRRRKVFVPAIGSNDYPPISFLVDGLPPTWRYFREYFQRHQAEIASDGDEAVIVAVTADQVRTRLNRSGSTRMTLDEFAYFVRALGIQSAKTPKRGGRHEGRDN